MVKIKFIILRWIYLVCLVAQPICMLAQTSNVQMAEAEQDGLSMAVLFEQSYASNCAVVLRYTIKNNSKSLHKFIRANDYFDVSVRLVSPAGQPVTAFRDMPGAMVEKHIKRFFIKDLAPGAYFEGSFDLAVEYPFEVTGDYRVLLTKRVYRDDPSVIAKTPHEPPGIVVELTSPELRFHVASIDRDFKSPLAEAVPNSATNRITGPQQSEFSTARIETYPTTQLDIPSASTHKKNPAAEPTQEPAPSTLWIVAAILIVAAIGLLGFWVTRRREKMQGK